MPSFCCLRGDCDNLALQEAGAFVVKDTAGQTWVCYEPSRWDMVQILSELEQAQGAAHDGGFSSQGTQVVQLDCGKEDLPSWLASML